MCFYMHLKKYMVEEQGIQFLTSHFTRIEQGRHSGPTMCFYLHLKKYMVEEQGLRFLTSHFSRIEQGWHSGPWGRHRGVNLTKPMCFYMHLKKYMMQEKRGALGAMRSP